MRPMAGEWTVHARYTEAPTTVAEALTILIDRYRDVLRFPLQVREEPLLAPNALLFDISTPNTLFCGKDAFGRVARAVALLDNAH